MIVRSPYKQKPAVDHLLRVFPWVFHIVLFTPMGNNNHHFHMTNDGWNQSVKSVFFYSIDHNRFFFSITHHCIIHHRTLSLTRRSLQTPFPPFDAAQAAWPRWALRNSPSPAARSNAWSPSRGWRTTVDPTMRVVVGILTCWWWKVVENHRKTHRKMGKP